MAFLVSSTTALLRAFNLCSAITLTVKCHEQLCYLTCDPSFPSLLSMVPPIPSPPNLTQSLQAFYPWFHPSPPSPQSYPVSPSLLSMVPPIPSLPPILPSLLHPFFHGSTHSRPPSLKNKCMITLTFSKKHG